MTVVTDLMEVIAERSLVHRHFTALLQVLPGGENAVAHLVLTDGGSVSATEH